MVVVVRLETPREVPKWALLEREMLQSLSDACEEFFLKYYDQEPGPRHGYGLWNPRWGGNDGPDDGAENGLNWTLAHMLGADEKVLEMWRIGWEGHLRQYTEAHTIEASPEAATTGMYYKDWSAQFDYFHHEEGHSAFVHQGLCEPNDPKLRERSRTYAAMYMGDDPEAENYDKENRLMRSLFTGSRGPLMRKATGLDWAGDKLVLPDDGGYGFRRPGEGGRVVDVPELLAARDGFAVGHHEESYQQMIDHFVEYTDVVGDHPLNIGTTTQVLLAYMLHGDQKYADHVVDYIDAWAERTAANGGIVPSNVGLDGTIGGETEGRWWGGAYGWGFNCVNPVTGERVWRNYAGRRTFYGFGNAMLLTGDLKYIHIWRDLLDAVNANTRVAADGSTQWPGAYGAFPGEEPGWNNWQDTPFSQGAEMVWWWTQDERDLRWAGNSPWRDFLALPLDSSARATFVEEELEKGLSALEDKVQRMRADPTTPMTRLSDDINFDLCKSASLQNALHKLMDTIGGGSQALLATWCGQSINPANDGVNPLLLLTCGTLPMGKNGCLLHARLRYFDPSAQRAGLPPDCAALIEAMDAESVTVSFVNVGSTERTVIVQAGAYGEHSLRTIAIDGGEPQAFGNGNGDGDGMGSLTVVLPPHCGGRLVLGMIRYANRPTLRFPWEPTGARM